MHFLLAESTNIVKLMNYNRGNDSAVVLSSSDDNDDDEYSDGEHVVTAESNYAVSKTGSRQHQRPLPASVLSSHNP